MTAAAPSGVVTFLFTDIEGSTRRWEADAGAMRAALPAHDEVLRAAIDGHGGFLFKHTGDGVCAAFSSPKSAATSSRHCVPLKALVRTIFRLNSPALSAVAYR
jgi:class 3 adenylate cyclase